MLASAHALAGFLAAHPPIGAPPAHLSKKPKAPMAACKVASFPAPRRRTLILSAVKDNAKACELYIPPAVEAFAADNGIPSLKYALAHGQDQVSEYAPYYAMSCDWTLAHSQDIFENLDFIDITAANAASVTARVARRVAASTAATKAGHTCAAARSLSLMIFIEKVLETTQHGSLGLKPIATVIKAISHLSISPEDALLRCQWRSLVARSALVLQIACCKHHDQLDIPMLVTFYESWARAPLYLGLSADNRCTQFRLVEDLRLLTPFKWEGVAPVTITPTEATRLLVAMANVAVRQRTYPSSTCVEFLATRLTACVARLTIAEMEAVAGAVAPLQWPTIPGSGAIRLLGAISEEAVRRMALKEESAVDCAAVLAVAVASAQSNRQRWQAVQLLENIEGWKEQYGEKAAKEHIHAALPAVVRTDGAQAAVSGNVVSTLRALGGALVASLLAATFFGSDA